MYLMLESCSPAKSEIEDWWGYLRSLRLNPGVFGKRLEYGVLMREEKTEAMPRLMIVEFSP